MAGRLTGQLWDLCGYKDKQFDIREDKWIYPLMKLYIMIDILPFLLKFKG